MSFLKAIGGLFKDGGLGGKIIDFVGGRWPEKMSQEDKAKIEMAITEAARSYELQLLEKAGEEEQRFNDRIKQMEGTASDLKSFGWFGDIIIFLRGAQRPIWGYVVIAMDIMVYSGRWHIPDDEQMKSAFWIINFLVLGFLFGERAVKNIIPLVSTYLGRKPNSAN